MESQKLSRISGNDVRENDDRISNLPEAILHHIFSFLETVDVALESSDFAPLPDENITCLTYHLKVVQINFVEDVENHLELVRFLLQNAHVLEKMVVVWQKSIEKIGEAMEKVMEFLISSPDDAVLHFGS